MNDRFLEREKLKKVAKIAIANKLLKQYFAIVRRDKNIRKITQKRD